MTIVSICIILGSHCQLKPLSCPFRVQVERLKAKIDEQYDRVNEIKTILDNKKNNKGGVDDEVQRHRDTISKLKAEFQRTLVRLTPCDEDTYPYSYRTELIKLHFISLQYPQRLKIVSNRLTPSAYVPA